MALNINLAKPDELPLVMEILGEAAAWLMEIGYDQWPSPPNVHWWRRMAAAIERQEVYIVGKAKESHGIVRLTWFDDYWPDDDLDGYVHSLAIRPKMRGQAVGGQILDWAVEQVRQRGKQFLRLDCLASNGRLCRYYEEQGFSYRGQLTDRDFIAALYEKQL